MNTWSLVDRYEFNQTAHTTDKYQLVTQGTTINKTKFKIRESLQTIKAFYDGSKGLRNMLGKIF